jgi:hypothetical protein
MPDDGGRRNLDHLLEAFRDDTLTSGDIMELTRLLTNIFNARAGSDIDGRTVQVGDKIAAAIVLRELNQVQKSMVRIEDTRAETT